MLSMFITLNEPNTSLMKVAGCMLYDWGLIPGRTVVFSLPLFPDMLWGPSNFLSSRHQRLCLGKAAGAPAYSAIQSVMYGTSP